MRAKLFHLPILLFLASCTPQNSNTSTDVLYADYSITGEEGAENITCLLRFYRAKNEGEALFLEPPASVSFDGTPLQADSARLSGAYYEVQKPLNGFSGTHTIIFKNAEGKEYRETFTFQPFSLTAALGKTVPRGDITLQLEGLQRGAQLQVLLKDTSFYTSDINEIDTVQNGQLIITRNALRNVASGPVTLYLFSEEERGLKNPPAGGGRLSITYSLSREFELVD
jgi:hypothetical protein